MRKLALVMIGLLLLGGCAGTFCPGDGSGLDAPGSAAPEPHPS